MTSSFDICCTCTNEEFKPFMPAVAFPVILLNALKEAAATNADHIFMIST